MLRLIFWLKVIFWIAVLALAYCGNGRTQRIPSAPWSDSLAANQRWTSEDGKISLEMEGNSSFGYGTFLVNGEEKKIAMHFPKTSRSPRVGIYDGKSILLVVTATYYSDPSEFVSFQTYEGTNATGDSSYDHWFTSLTRKSIPDEELDAKNFIVDSFKNEDEGLTLEYHRDNWISLEQRVIKDAEEENRKRAYSSSAAYRGFSRDSLFINELYGEKGDTYFIFHFQDDNAFYISVKNESPAKGSYVTNPDGVALTFSEDTLLGYAGKSVGLKANEITDY